jgi:excisionase family DNA binding protein
MSDLLTVKQAAHMLQVSTGTLDVWRCTKRYPLRFVKVGRSVRYRAADLEEFLNRRTESGISEPAVSRAKRRG